MKYFVDYIFSFFASILLLPVVITIVFLMIALMPGPFLFKQQRIGKSGKPFCLYKFRSMSVLKDASKGTFHVGDTSRITPFGKILRKTKLDELPQLFNVLKGDMSIVGPRPEVEKWTKVYPEKWAIVHKVKPGITDNASILFRNEEEILKNSPNPEEAYKNEILPRKLDLYIDYVNNHSLLGDMKIIFHTVKVVLFK